MRQIGDQDETRADEARADHRACHHRAARRGSGRGRPRLPGGREPGAADGTMCPPAGLRDPAGPVFHPQAAAHDRPERSAARPGQGRGVPTARLVLSRDAEGGPARRVDRAGRRQCRAAIVRRVCPDGPFLGGSRRRPLGFREERQEGARGRCHAWEQPRVKPCTDHWQTTPPQEPSWHRQRRPRFASRRRPDRTFGRNRLVSGTPPSSPWTRRRGAPGFCLAAG